MIKVNSFFLTFLLLLIGSSPLLPQAIGHWQMNSNALPVFNYTGPVDYQEVSNGFFPDDPWFILGNYRLIVFPHVSGQYEMVTGERAWSRVNHKEGISGGNFSKIKIGNADTLMLTGMTNEIARKATKTFGTGFARFEYELDGVTVQRILSTLPGTKYNESIPAMLTKVTIRNNSPKKLKISFTEAMLVDYTDFRDRTPSGKGFVVQHKVKPIKETSSYSSLGFITEYEDPYLIPSADGPSKYDGIAPNIYMRGSVGTQVHNIQEEDGNTWFHGTCEFVLPSNQKKEFYFVTGLSFNDSLDKPEEISAYMIKKAEKKNGDIPFLSEWKNKLPAFSEEEDVELRTEMIWNAYVLEVMATYNSFYKQTYIPQGCAYEFARGSIAASRDHLQHSLPLNYYNSELSKSILLYVMKKMLRNGEIPLAENGVGFTTNMHWQASDQQLYFFLALSEYLRITQDYQFLNEKIENVWSRNGSQETVMHYLSLAYIFFRDEIRTGLRGLPRLMNADWNDQLVNNAKVEVSFHQSSSHLNASLAVLGLKNLSDQLRRAIEKGYLQNDASALQKSMEMGADKIWDALRSEIDDRSFSPRAWLNNETQIGTDYVYLAPQSFLLQIDDFPLERKIKLLEVIESRLKNEELLGARSSEKAFEVKRNAGEGENGGIWYALNCPAIVGVAGFDVVKAKQLLKNIGFHNYAKHYPDYWIGHWTGPDHFNSSLSDYPGMTNRIQSSMTEFPAFCAHAHAWPLYSYYRILNNK